MSPPPLLFFQATLNGSVASCPTAYQMCQRSSGLAALHVAVMS
jgi:hypothetical protein